MAGQALSQVSAQMSMLQGFAHSALATAQSALGSLTGLDLPTGYASAYSFTLPSYHAPSEASRPGVLGITTAPSIDTIIIPTKVTKPDIDTVTMGGLTDITLPEVPTIEFPSLDLTPPVYSVTEPTQWSMAVNSNILISDDPLIQAAINRLTDNINNGGTGLDAEIETAIWNRELEREEQQLEDTTDKVISMWAKKGFSLPDGMLANSLSDIQKDYLNQKLTRSREISIKQAELEQSNIFKSLELAVNLADRLINMYIRYEELVFRTNEATARFANEYLDLQIKTYMAKVEGYKAQAAVYEMKIRAELSKVEVYKAQIDAQRLIGEVNQQTVQVYSEQIRATSMLIERYRIEVQAMVSELETEKLKIEANKLQMDTWAKQMEVNIAKYNGEIEMYKASSQVNVAAAECYNKHAEAQMRIAVATMESNVRGYEIQDRGIVARAQIAMEAARGVAIAAGSMAAGAVAAMSAHASMSYSEQATDSDANLV